MIVYDKLIRRLRKTSMDFGELDDASVLLLEAAIAIEELSHRIDQAVDMYNRDIEKAAMYEVLIGSSPEPPKEEE